MGPPASQSTDSKTRLPMAVGPQEKKTAFSKVLAAPIKRSCHHRFMVGLGHCGLTCPGWHSRVVGVYRSLAGSPASGTHTGDVGEIPGYPEGHQGRTRLSGSSRVQEEHPQTLSAPTSAIVPRHTVQPTHLEPLPETACHLAVSLKPVCQPAPVPFHFTPGSVSAWPLVSKSSDRMW